MSVVVAYWFGISGVGCFRFVVLGVLGVCVSGSGWWEIGCVGGVVAAVVVFSYFFDFCASSCSGISLPPALYVLLWGSGSSVL